MRSAEPLPRSTFARTALEVAPDLLGTVVRSSAGEGDVAVRLTEVEAYEGESDPGSHAFRGRTARNAVMYGEPGNVYVYFSYGVHWCMNLVCGPVGTASAVLLRAGEVVAGLEAARARRPSARADRDLCRGPARLCQALGVTGMINGSGAVAGAPQGSPLLVVRGLVPDPSTVRTGPRTGVSGQGAAMPYRFWIDGEPTVSRYRPAVPRQRR